MKQGIQHLTSLSFLIITLLIICSCGDAGTRVGNPPTTSSAYPVNLAIASPLEASPTAITSLNATTEDSSVMYTAAIPSYNNEVNTILEGTTITDCSFGDLDSLADEIVNADCYGPAFAYENHPNGDNSSGIAGSGDAGIWMAIDPVTNEACAAAQLNARLDGFSIKNLIIQKVLASTICTMNVNSLSFAANDTPLDLTDEMTDMLTQNSITATTITSASITVSTDSVTGNTVYTYSLVLNHTETGETTAIPISINMQHEPMDADNDTYIGHLSFSLPDEQAGLCPTETTNATSVLYNMGESDNLKFRAESAMYCGLNVDPFVDGLLDPTDTFDATTNPTGWTSNRINFQSDFDFETFVGFYSYSWQAGQSDGFMRALNISLELDVNNLLVGDAYFGFSADAALGTYDNTASGFICNWSLPGNSRTLVDLVQYQEIQEGVNGLFTPTQSKITYSPQVECSYLSSDPHFGTFSYDTDGDGVVDTNPNTEVINDLLITSDVDGDGYIDAIIDSGIILPVTLTDIN